MSQSKMLEAVLAAFCEILQGQRRPSRLDADGGVDALSATQEATPDTVVMTKDLTQSATLTAKDKKEAEEEKDTQDTVMLSDDEAEVERAPGLFEEYPGYLDSSDSDGEMPSLVVFSSTWN